MSLCVVAFPAMSEADSQWIQAIRARYDPQYDEIAPHVTLLFPTEAFELDELAAHVEDVARDVEAFDLKIRCALPYQGPLSSRFYLFLVPDEGFSNLVRLHDQLCQCAYPDRTRIDVPFIPHVTVGVFDDGTECKRTADRLNLQRFEISSRVSALSIVPGEGDAVVHRQILLGGQG